MIRFVPTRWSHLVGYSGVGSIVRADNDLFVIKDTTQWTNRDGSPAGDLIPYVSCLRDTLGIGPALRAPPISDIGQDGEIIGTCLPAIRFPRWTRCPRCGLLHWNPWRDEEPKSPNEDTSIRCSECDNPPKLQQLGWVVASVEGGMDEVPWELLAHEPQKSGCRHKKSEMKILLRPNKSGRWTLKCKKENCTSHEQVFNSGKPVQMFDPSQQPWVWSDLKTRTNGKVPGQILEVGDPRSFFPRTRTALVIPPESRVRRGTVVDRLYSNRADLESIETARTPLSKKQSWRLLATKYGCTPGEIEGAWEEIRRGYPLFGQTSTKGDLLPKEFKALCEEIPDLVDGEDFVPRHRTKEWRALAATAGIEESKIIKLVNRLVGVTRLREIRIFEGFSRIQQSVDDGLKRFTIQDSKNEGQTAKLVPPDLVGRGEWLPAIELFGEGIFFTLSPQLLSLWAEQPKLIERIRILERRFEASRMDFPDMPLLPLDSRFVLLHTLAHLLIRQLESRAGYPAASLRERIYYSREDHSMTGILIYVAVPDIVGSLGGLAELAEPRRFLQLLTGTFSNADWCSLDPVCIEHQGQGPNQTNMAACHACALVPETSCLFNNSLLDRAFVRGSLHSDIASILEIVKSVQR